MERRVLILGCSIAAIAFACAPRSTPPNAAQQSEPRTMVREPEVRSATLTSALDVEARETVRFSLAVENTTGRAVELLFPSGRTHDVVVYDARGVEVWRWSAGRMFTQAPRTRVVRHRGAVAFDATWERPLPGSYVAVASLSDVARPLTQQVAFTVR